jgi:hypothetical protein
MSASRHMRATLNSVLESRVVSVGIAAGRGNEVYATLVPPKAPQNTDRGKRAVHESVRWIHAYVPGQARMNVAIAYSTPLWPLRNFMIVRGPGGANLADNADGRQKRHVLA